MSNDTTKNPGFNAAEARQATHNAFVPLLLALIAFILILGWTLTVTIRQASSLQGLKFQVWQATTQSAQAEEKLKGMLSELVDLASEDPAAAAIVKRYKIKQNAPVVAPTTTKPAAKPAVKATEKPAVKATERAAEKPAPEAAAKPAAKATEKSAQE